MTNFDPILAPSRIEEMRTRDLWRDRLVSDYLDDAVAAKADATAIVDLNSMTGQSTRLTYRELDCYAKRIACGLAALGVQRGDVVGVQLPNWWHYAAIYTACVRIGAVVNPLMPIFRERELEFMLGLAETRVLIVPRAFRGFDYPTMARGLQRTLPHLEHVFVVDGQQADCAFEACLLDREWEQEIDPEPLFAKRRPDPNDVTELIYTSGTTGEPKGVMHSANTLLCKARLASELFSFNDDDVIFMGSPLAHQTGFMYAVILAIYQQTKCVLQDVWEPRQAARLIEEERCTITLGSTPFLSDLVRTQIEHAQDVRCLRLFLCAGAPIPRVLLHQAQDTHPDLYVMSAWGMTEMGIATATYPGDPAEKVFETDGRALPHQEVRIVDDEGLVVADGVEGRLQSRCA
ncbi:MAG: AMP-binding protein, partial [Proteobacteria bacterium]|nr:AMP-binding protein [Pseudomonadota bacterium]